MGGRGSSSGMNGGGNGAIQAKAAGIAHPNSREDYINRAEFIAEVSGNAKYNYDVSVSDWQNYGKDRTYIKLNQKYSDGTVKQSIDMGYYDNNKGEYVKGRTKNADLGEQNVWDFQGSTKYTETDIADYLKKKKKK